MASQSRKAKAVYSEEERKELIQAFDDGMDGVGADKSAKISELAASLKRSQQEIKVVYFY